MSLNVLHLGFSNVVDIIVIVVLGRVLSISAFHVCVEDHLCCRSMIVSVILEFAFRYSPSVERLLLRGVTHRRRDQPHLDHRRPRTSPPVAILPEGQIGKGNGRLYRGLKL